MDINDLRGFTTVLVLIAFIGICWWAFAPKRKQRFEDDAKLPFADDELHALAQTKKPAAGDRASASSENDKRDTL